MSISPIPTVDLIAVTTMCRWYVSLPAHREPFFPVSAILNSSINYLTVTLIIFHASDPFLNVETFGNSIDMFAERFSQMLNVTKRENDDKNLTLCLTPNSRAIN